jgi:hypothetical protein
MPGDTHMTEQELLTQLVDYFEEWEQTTRPERSQRERERDYYDSKQWTEEEVARLKSRRQPVVTYNRIAPKINSLRGLESSRRAEPRAFPRNTPSDDQSAGAASDALKYVLDSNAWDQLCGWVFLNHIIEGAGGVDISVEKKPDGEPCIYIKWISWDRMWGDVHSRNPDWSDSLVRGQFLWMDLKQAKLKWPNRADILENSGEEWYGQDTYDDTPRTKWSDPKRKRIRVAECYFKEGDTWYFAQFTRSAILEVIESPWINEDQVTEPGFVFSSCFVDKEGNRYGMVKAWMSVQDEINKRRSKAMHLLNSNRVQMERGTVEDINKMKRELADPNGVVETRPGKKIEMLDNLELADAHQRLGSEAKAEIDSVGVNAALAGTERRVMSGRALEQRSEQGLNEVGPCFSTWEAFKLEVYRKLWNRIRQFWTAEKWIRVTEDEENIRFVGLNVPMTLGEKLLEQFKQQPDVSPEDLAMAEEQAQNDPEMQQVVGLRNNVGELDVDIRMGEQPASASLQGEQFDRLAEIAPNAGAMPPVLFEALVEASSLRGKDKILRKLRGEDKKGPPPEVVQMQEQMQQLTEQVQMNDIKTQQAQLEADRKLFEMEKRAITAELRLEQQKLIGEQQQLAAAVSAASQPQEVVPS